MAGSKDNTDRLEIVAAGLKELADDVIFIGGACIQFYVSDPELRDYRLTRDIDCIIKTYSYGGFTRYCERLRELEFKHDDSEGAPINRWNYQGVLVDTIPDKSSSIGFKEIKWFSEGREQSIKTELPSGKMINILPLSFYMATKLEASQNRGGEDFPADHDIEDIINIIDGNEDLKEILSAPVRVRSYLLDSFKRLLGADKFKRSVAGHIGYETSAVERAGDVIEKMMNLVKGNR
ncbi:hypothetical protein ACFL5V_05425 [Fibrobacterota bacterium]